MTSKRYIAWDTSSTTGVVVAFEIVDQKFRLVAEWSLSFETGKHSERLLWSIDLVLKSAGWKIEDLSAIGVGMGPGSFTGLRIGITTAKILSFQLKIPVISISSLALLARGAVSFMDSDRKHEKNLIVACTDATKGEWFTLLGPLKSVKDCIVMAEGDSPGIWARGTIEKTLTPEEVMESVQSYLKKNPKSSWMALGQSVERYPEIWKKLPQKRRFQPVSLMLNQVQPRILATLVWESIQQGLVRNPADLKPRYLRESEAEVKLKKGKLKPAPVAHRGGIA